MMVCYLCVQVRTCSKCPETPKYLCVLVRYTIQMGVFTVTAKVQNPHDDSKSCDITLIVDTGATYTQLPATLLQDLGIDTPKEKHTQLANGQIVKQRMGEAVIWYENDSWSSPVVAVDQGPAVLGAVTLETFALAVDPVQGKLVPTTFHLVPRIVAIPGEVAESQWRPPQTSS